jgi:uncharacterized membrane protein YgcG
MSRKAKVKRSKGENIPCRRKLGASAFIVPLVAGGVVLAGPGNADAASRVTSPSSNDTQLSMTLTQIASTLKSLDTARQPDQMNPQMMMVMMKMGPAPDAAVAPPALALPPVINIKVKPVAQLDELAELEAEADELGEDEEQESEAAEEEVAESDLTEPVGQPDDDGVISGVDSGPDGVEPEADDNSAFGLAASLGSGEEPDDAGNLGLAENPSSTVSDDTDGLVDSDGSADSDGADADAGDTSDGADPSAGDGAESSAGVGDSADGDSGDGGESAGGESAGGDSSDGGESAGGDGGESSGMGGSSSGSDGGSSGGGDGGGDGGGE